MFRIGFYTLPCWVNIEAVCKFELGDFPFLHLGEIEVYFCNRYFIHTDSNAVKLLKVTCSGDSLKFWSATFSKRELHQSQPSLSINRNRDFYHSIQKLFHHCICINAKNLLLRPTGNKMSFSLGLRQPITRCISSPSACARVLFMQTCRRDGTALAFGRCLSSSSKTPNSVKDSRKVPDKQKPTTLQEKRQLSAARKASILLSQMKKAGNRNPQTGFNSTPEKSVPTPKVVKPANVKPALKNAKIEDKPFNEESETIIISSQEAAIQRRILANQGKIFWPGIWTFFALTGTVGALAFISAITGSSSNTGEPSEGTQLPQTWYLTPTVIMEGFKAGWRELDYLTIGIVVTTIGFHLLKKAPIRFWEHLLHITGEKKYTAFTYPYVHADWEHVFQNMAMLCWFLPGVVHYLDGDLPQAAALFVGVPLITSYLQHFTFRWGWISGIPVNLGASGSISAIFGAFCMLYPDEKVWTPAFAIVRLDAKYWGLLFAFWQISALAKPPSTGARPAHLVCML